MASGGSLQRLRAAAGAVLDHHAEAAGIADAGDRRRLHHEDQRLLDRRQNLPKQRPGDGGGRLARIAGALLPRLEGEEDRAGIGRIGEGRAGEADEVDAVRDARRLERDVDGALVHLVGARQRGARRQLDHHDEIAAVDLRDEARPASCGTR